MTAGATTTSGIDSDLIDIEEDYSHSAYPCDDGWQREPESFEDACRYLRGGVATPYCDQG